MQGTEQDIPVEKPPRVWKILGTLAGAALLFSWLGAYAVTNALANADLIRRPSREHDPRPLWMIESFLTLLATFMIVGGVMRLLSRRQLKDLASMESEMGDAPEPKQKWVQRAPE